MIFRVVKVIGGREFVKETNDEHEAFHEFFNAMAFAGASAKFFVLSTLCLSATSKEVEGIAGSKHPMRHWLRFIEAQLLRNRREALRKHVADFASGHHSMN